MVRFINARQFLPGDCIGFAGHMRRVLADALLVHEQSIERDLSPGVEQRYDLRQITAHKFVFDSSPQIRVVYARLQPARGCYATDGSVTGLMVRLSSSILRHFHPLPQRSEE